jgi:hypothetical protein
MTHTVFRDKDLFVRELVLINKTLKEELGKINIGLNEQGFPFKKNTYHFLLQFLKPGSRIERTIYMLLLQAAYQSELLSSGSAYLCIRFANEFIEELVKHPDLLNGNNIELFESFESLVDGYKEKLRDCSFSITQEQLSKELEKISDDPVLSSAIWEALMVSGLEGKIHVEDGTLANYVVEQKSGYYFNTLKPFKFMLPLEGVWEACDVKVMLVDGILERVSELDKILNGAMTTKTPVLLVAHGFSEEVVSTIKANVDYKNFNIMPVRLTPDLESLNIINDIAVVSGGDIVSTLKGQMVCFTEFDSLPFVERVRLTSKELCIENPKTRKAVSNHLRMLLEKRQANHAVADISDLVDKRIQGLLAASVILRLPNMTNAKRDATKIKIDVALRTAKTLLSYGAVNFHTIVFPEIKDPLAKSFVKSLQNIQKEFDTLPAISAYVGVWFAGKAVLNLMTTSGLVENVMESQ